MATRKIRKKETLGRFRIAREIGRGGSGVVYEATDPRTNRKVALKVLPAIRALDGERVRRFLREAETARHLAHDNIVSLLEIGEERGTYFLVMQYVDGRPLDVLWKEELIDFRSSVSVVSQCLQALEYAHGMGIVHLDVKPQNILVDRKGKAYLTDFGLARVVSGTGEKGGPVAGTPKYMSPEQAEGAGPVDFRSDIYSLGVTLYNLLTYTHPFEGEEIHLILKSVIAGDFPRPRDINNRIPARLEAVVLKAMERRLPRRYQTAGEFRADLESFLKGESVTASVPILKRRGLRTLTRRRSLFAVLGAAVLAVAALVAVQVWLRGRAGPDPSAEADAARLRRARELSAEGDQFFQQRRLEEALRAYDHALELAPGDAVTLVKRGQIHARRGSLERAEADFSAALWASPGLDIAYLGRGEVRIERKELAGARSDFERALGLLASRAREPEAAGALADALTGMGRVRFEAGDAAGAVGVLEQALGHRPDNPRAHLFLGLAHLAEGRRDRAFEEIKTVTELEPTNLQAKLELERLKLLEVAGLRVQVPILQAAAHLNQGKYRQAAEYCQEALKIEPGHPEALILLARARMATGRADEALADLDAVLAAGDPPPAARSWRARALRLLGRNDDAADEALRALEETPAQPDALRERALALAARGDDGTLAALEAAAAALPADLEILEALAEAYLDGGRHVDALRTAAAIHEKIPHHAAASEVRALAHWALGQSDAALREADHALAVDPDLARSHLVRARVLLGQARPADALPSARKAAADARARPEALRLELRALVALDRADALADACTRLLAVHPQDPEALEIRGRARLDAGDLEGAENDYHALIAARPALREGHLGRALALNLLGRHEQARDAARNALLLGDDPKALGLLGWALTGLRHHIEALEPLRRAMEGLPREGTLRAQIGLARVRALRALGRGGDALAALADGLPATDTIRLLHALILLDLARPDEAARILQALPDARPGVRQARARLALAQGRAAQAWETLEALGPDEALSPSWTAFARAAVLRALGRTDDALGALDDALALDPDLNPALRERARLRKEAGLLDASLADLDRAVKGNPGDAALRLQRAEGTAPRPERREQTLEDLEIAGQAFPRDAQVFQLRAQLLLERGDGAAALGDLERLEVLAPERWEWPSRRAEVLEGLHRYGEAAAAWEKAARVRGQRDEAMERRRIHALLLGGAYEAVLEASTPDRARSGRLRLWRGAAQLALGRFTEAAETAGTVLSAEPALALEARCLRAEALLLRGARARDRGEETEDFVNAYFDIQRFYPQASRGEGLEGPARARVFTVMGLYQRVAEGNRARAVEDFERALAADPGAREAHRLLGAAAAEEGGLQPAAGLDHLQRALALGHPDRDGIALDRGRCLERLERPEEARAEYEGILERIPTHAEARRRLAALER